MTVATFGEPKGTYWPVWQLASTCAATKFRKNETFTPHEFHEKCGIDYHTAKKYVPLMEGKDLGGGKKILSTKVATDGYVVDPPGEGSLEVARNECCRICDCDQTKKANEPNSIVRTIIAVSVVGALLLMIGLAATAARRSIVTCGQCGTRVDVTELNHKSFRCPTCGQEFVRQPEAET